MIQILFSDLTEEKQAEILSAFGDNCNYDVIPIAMLIEPKDLEEPNESQEKDRRETTPSQAI